MKTVPTALQTKLDAGVTTFADGLIITRADGVTLRFNSCGRDVVLGGHTYLAAAAFTRSAATAREGLSVDNQDLVGLIDDDLITEADIRAGKYVGANLHWFVFDYEAPADGMIMLDAGQVGRVTLRGNQWTAEFLSLTAQLEREIGGKIGRMCRATLGDDDCGVNLAPHTYTGTVTASAGVQEFTDTARTQADQWFRFGIVTWLTGDNAGFDVDVKASTAAGVITLRLPMPFQIQVGDTYQIVAGCNHLLKMPGDSWGSPYTGDCREKFNKVVRFRGEADIPSSDEVLRAAE